MHLLHKCVLIMVFFRSSSVSAWEDAPQLSLWGNVAEFDRNRDFWTLQKEVSVPALRAFTVCFSLQLKSSDSSMWTAFEYQHPVKAHKELGFGGKSKSLMVWLFGIEFRTVHATNLINNVWYDLCITWAEDKGALPSLYLDGTPLEIQTDTPLSPSCYRFASSGSLTLGASHDVASGRLEPLSEGRLKGKVSVFRMWSRERSREEVTSLKCTEGDVVKWELSQWDTAACAPTPDSSLECEWSSYEVKLRFVIFTNNTELYLAKDLARRWLEQVLPDSVYLPNVSVFKDTLTSRSSVESPHKNRGTAPFTRFRCLVHLNMIPGRDVAAVQSEVRGRLSEPFHDTDTTFELLAGKESIYITAIVFSSSTTSPLDPTATAPTSDPCVSATSSATTFASSPTTAASTTATTAADTTQQTTFTTSSFSTTATVGQTTGTGFSSGTTFSSDPSTSTTAASETSPAPTSSTLRPFSPGDVATSRPAPPSAATAASAHTTAPATVTSPTTPGAFTTPVPVLYFEVQVNVSLTGASDPERAISLWLNTSLPDDTMTVLDLQLLTKAAKAPRFLHARSIVDGTSRESCVFQVEVSRLDSEPLEIEELIQSLLEEPFSDGAASIAADGDILVSRIFDFQCSAETRHTRTGQFHWPETSGGRNATLRCPKNRRYSATRHCKICMQTYWQLADTSSCPLVVEVIHDLEDLDVTEDNAHDILDMIEDLLKNKSHLDYRDLATVLNKVEDIISVSVVTPPLGQALLDVISDVLESQSDLQPFTNLILNITECLGDKMTGYHDCAVLSAPYVGMSVVDVEPGHFKALSFGVLAERVEIKPEIFINRFPLNGTVAYISLPSVLQQDFPHGAGNLTPPRIHFQFFGVPWLFKTKPSDGMALNTFVVSASVTNASSPICDLEEDVRITLHHLRPNHNNKDVQCVFWNFNLNDGDGDWDPTGCRKHHSDPQYTTCFCDHLTHFGVLLDVSRTPLDPKDEYRLTIITYVGCGISSLFLGVTILTYTAFEKLRRDYPSQILINLSLALLGLNLILLVNSWLSSMGIYGLCIFVATTLHYFVLASFTWMGLEAVHMYFALVKVFNVYVPSYILKFCALGWGVPLVVCVVLLIVDREAYGSHLYTESLLRVQPADDSDNFCWIQDRVAFYVTVVGYAAVVFLLNTGVFVAVLIQIRRMRYNSPAGIRSGLLKDLKGVASLTLLLGLTWAIGFFTWGPARVAMLFLFSALNSFQGLFIFIFHCLMKENVRKQWRIHLCFGRFRLEENSEWSASASFGLKPRPPAAQARVPSVRSVKSSSTESTSASSESSQRESVISNKRPDLGLFVTGLVTPRAQCSSSGPVLRSHGSLNPTPGWTKHLLTQEHR